MAALPYMQLYVADYLADTAHLSAQEHGAYLLLIFNYWQRGESFKAKDEQTLNRRLASVARLSNEEFENVRETISEFFVVSETEWSHTRIERDLDAVSSKSEKAKAAGKASAARRSSERSADVQQTLNHTDTDTDTDTDTEKEVNIPADAGMFGVTKKSSPEEKNKKATEAKQKEVPSEKFEAFWKAWPSNFRKVGKKVCANRWNRGKLDDHADAVMACLERTKASPDWENSEFIPMPATWLKREPWLETNVILLGYTDAELAVIEKYNRVMVAAGWPEATVELYSRDRAVAIGQFLKFSDKPGDWVTAYFEWLAEALEPRHTTGFDWAIRKETFLRAKEGTFAVRAAQ